MKPTLYRLRPFAKPEPRHERQFRVNLDALETFAWVFVGVSMASGAAALVWSFL